ncbi:MAG TPA: hemin ABC transporter substrate-binding protein [Myxococcaceae bacterium]|nr:hemin ABC transporter substrate-binding protein [Myxococcaceae bacterium]
MIRHLLTLTLLCATTAPMALLSSGCKRGAAEQERTKAPESATPEDVPAMPLTLRDATGAEIAVEDTSRIVSSGGTLTEIVHALGFGDRLVGVDTSSLHPGSVTRLPKIGYQRQLSAEGVLSLSPSLILASEESGPPPVMAQLRASGTPLFVVPTEHTVDGAKATVRTLGTLLEREDAARALVEAMERDLASARDLHPSDDTTRPRVLFIYARGQGTLNVAGEATAGDVMIGLAGGVNAVRGFEGYRPLTAESVVSAAPDVILMTRMGSESVGGGDSVFELPGLALTPAARTRRLVVMDDLLLLGFGPRTGEAALELARALHGAAPSASAAPEGGAP